MDGDVEMLDVDQNQGGSICVTFKIKNERDHSAFPLREFIGVLDIFEVSGYKLRQNASYQ